MYDIYCTVICLFQQNVIDNWCIRVETLKTSITIYIVNDDMLSGEDDHISD